MSLDTFSRTFHDVTHYTDPDPDPDPANDMYTPPQFLTPDGYNVKN